MMSGSGMCGLLEGIYSVVCMMGPWGCVNFDSQEI